MTKNNVADLYQLYNKGLMETKALEKEIDGIENQLRDKKYNHAKKMMEFCKVNIYKQRAKYDNENNYFQWIDSEKVVYENKGDFLNEYSNFETPTMRLKIRLQHRKDLKVWKYEVHVSGNKVHFESFEHIKMYERNKKEGWHFGWNNILLDYFKENELSQKFKTIEDANICIEKWKKDLQSQFSNEINYDKSLYRQACEKYKHSIRLELNYECAERFYKLIKTYDLEIEKGDYWHVEVSGTRAKEIVKNIKTEHNMTFAILAG